jgi:uncharacterized protein
MGIYETHGVLDRALIRADDRRLFHLPRPEMEPTAGSSFSDEDFEQLDAWLLKRAKGIYDIVTLEGFLTAIVICPNTISPMVWLPKVWGRGKPEFKDLEDLNRFVGLVMGLHNELAGCFAQDPASFEPSFYESPLNDKTVIIVDEWCDGFVKGMRMDSEAWKPLKRERPELLMPMELFGTRAGWRKLEAGGEAAMHATWSVRIAPAVRAIHAYWLPYRRAALAMPGDAVRH